MIPSDLTEDPNMMYDERIVNPMRQELTQLGIQEARTAADVDAVLRGRQCRGHDRGDRDPSS